MNLTIIIISLIAALWFIGVFFGFIGGVPKTFQNQGHGNIDAKKTQQHVEKTVEDTQEKQRRMMEDIQQKMRDSANRY